MQESSVIKKFKEPKTKEVAFREIVSNYQERIYWHVRKIVISHDDADDVTQEAFIKIYRGLENFREDSQLFTWIYRIATNEALNHLKKQKRRTALSLDDAANELENHLSSGTYISGDEIQMKLQKALLKLPKKQRLVFNMKYFDDLKYDEISSITDTSVGALKASYHIAVKKIEEELNKD